MRFKKPVLKLALDEGVPDSVGKVLQNAGHKVTFLNKANELPRGSKDKLVCEFAILNNFILVAMDGDMRQIARSHGAGKSSYKMLSLIKISCRETVAADRMRSVLTLIEHEWHYSQAEDGRRIFIDVMDSAVKSNR